MRNKLLLISLLALACLQTTAQNLQFHWDFLEPRNYPTITFEMYNADQWGDTFLFVDLDYDNFENQTCSYMEIRRNFSLGSSTPILVGVEYNGGMYDGGAIDNAWLAGATYPFALGSTFCTLTASYKHIMRSSQSANAQITGTWATPIWEDRVTFTGFFDLWTEGNMTEDGRKVVFLAEPQLWYNFTQHFALGTEVELSQNFIYGEDNLQVFPTLGAKWTF